jgi:hypothetical protein
MPLERANFDDVTEQDLLDLIAAGVPEGLSLEYKREPWSSTDADKREALKDITSFANSVGGHVILGMEEKAGLPKRLTGLPDVDLDQLTNRLGSLVRDGIEPRAVGVRMRSVATAGGSAMVIRIPRSWNPPHRVRVGGWNKFFVRNSGGVHEADVEELRVLFTVTADARERMQVFRADRIAKVARNLGPVWFHKGGLLFLHVIPLSAFTQPQQLSPEEIFREGALFAPIGTDGARTPRFNLDGFINIRGGEICHGYTQVFRNGIVEATKAGIKSEWEHGEIVHWSEVPKLVSAVPKYIEGLRRFGISPPLVVMISMQGVEGAKLGLKGYDRDLAEIAAFPRGETLLLPDVLLEGYSTEASVQRSLIPALDALWNAAGFSRCTYYDDEGNWTPPAVR